MRRPLITAAVLALSAASAAAQTPRDHIVRALDAIGGETAVRGVGGYTVDLHTAQFGIGQSELPASPPRATLTIGRVVTDVRGNRRYTAAEARPVAGMPQRARVAVANGRGATGNIGAQAPLAPAAVINNQRAIRTLPDRLLLAALDGAPARAAGAREFRGEMHDGVRLEGADTLTLWFERASGLPTVMETVTDDPILGDRVTQTFMTRWHPAGRGVRFPRQMDVFVNGQLSVHTVHSAVTAEESLADSFFTIPDSILARGPAVLPPPAPIVVRMVELGPGVWRAEGSTHHSLVVDQGTALVVVEAPQSTHRVRALLDTLAGRFPGRRVSTLVMTHHHWDHSGGIREIVAEGIPVVTRAGNAAFVRQVAAARRTVAPDLQARRRRQPVIRTFGDSVVLGSGERQVVLYAQPTNHADGLLTAWVPGVRVLFTSDVLNPGATLAPAGSAELVALARARGLAPATYAGGHGALVPWPDVETAAAAAR